MRTASPNEHEFPPLSSTLVTNPSAGSTTRIRLDSFTCSGKMPSFSTIVTPATYVFQANSSCFFEPTMSKLAFVLSFKASRSEERRVWFLMQIYLNAVGLKKERGSDRIDDVEERT